MKGKRRVARWVLAAMSVAAIGSVASGAAADGGSASAPLVATITGGQVGSRTITLAAATPMASVLAQANLTGSLQVVVAEAARTGTNPWSVTAQAGALSDGNGHTIPAANVSVSGRGVTQTLGGGSSTPSSGR